MSGKPMTHYERQTVLVHRRFAKAVRDEYATKALNAAKRGRVYEH
jgi:hypothetical protein